MKKKIIKTIVVLVVMISVVARISYVNISAPQTATKVYELGETVALDGSFTDIAAENTAGYSISVESAELLSYEEFMLRFHKPQDYLSKNSRKTTALLKVKITNEGNATGGISVNRLFLFNETMSVYFNYDNSYLAVANPEIGTSLMGIRLKPDTEYTIYFPFAFEYGPKPESYLDLRKEGETSTFYLRVSTYPIKNLIKIVV